MTEFICLKGLLLKRNNEPQECIIYIYYYFFNVYFRFQSEVCDGCHSLTQNCKQ